MRLVDLQEAKTLRGSEMKDWERLTKDQFENMRKHIKAMFRGSKIRTNARQEFILELPNVTPEQRNQNIKKLSYFFNDEPEVRNEQGTRISEPPLFKDKHDDLTPVQWGWDPLHPEGATMNHAEDVVVKRVTYRIGYARCVTRNTKFTTPTSDFIEIWEQTTPSIGYKYRLW